MARRIVPELISPSQASAAQPEFVAAADQPLNLRLNLKEEAELAKTLLGPGRKLYIDISTEPKVNWRKLQKRLGLSLTKPQQKALQPELAFGDRALPSLGSGPALGGSNALARVIERLEAGYAHTNTGSEDSDSSHPQSPDAGREAGSDPDDEAAPIGEYELDDEFIDDSEVHEYYEGDWRKPKHTGFYINNGEVEKTDEFLLQDDNPSPQIRRRKPKKPVTESPEKPLAGKEKGMRQVIGKDGEPKMLKKKRNTEASAAASHKAGAAEMLPPKAKTPGKVLKRPNTATAGPAKQAVAGQQEPAAPSAPTPAPGAATPQEGSIAGGPPFARQVGATPEEDKVPLAVMAAAGATPLRPQALAESLPNSPPAAAEGQAQAAAPGEQHPGARTPQTGKKRKLGSEGHEGGPGYAIPAHVKTILDQLKALAEELGLQDAIAEGAAGGAPSEESTDPSGRSEKPQKKLPTQLNPLLAKLARHAATENDRVTGARTTIANAAYSFLYPWTQKGNMAVRLKKLHESAQQRYDKCQDWLTNAVAGQSTAIKPEQKLSGSEEDFAAAAAQQDSAVDSSKLQWEEGQIYALVEFVFALMELRGGSEDNPRLWQDVAGKSELWGTHTVTAQELQTMYMQNKRRYAPEADGQPRKRPRKARPLSGGQPETARTSGTLDEVLSQRHSGQDQSQSEPPSKSLSPAAAPATSNPSATGAAAAAAVHTLPSAPMTAARAADSPLIAAALPESGTAQHSTAEQPQPASNAVGSTGIGPSEAPAPSALQPPASVPSAQGVEGSSIATQPSQGGADATPGQPTREVFLQMGVQQGGDYAVLARGLQGCRNGTIKDTTYKVLLHAGPGGMKVAKIVETAQGFGLVPSDWVKPENRNSRASQISNAIRNTDVFVHVGDHKYAIGVFPGVEPVILNTTKGKRSADKAGLEDYDIKAEPPQASAPTADHGSVSQPIPAQVQPALSGSHQIPIAPGGLAIQPLNAHMGLESLAETAVPDYRSQVVMHAPMQPVSSMPPILTASLNAALQPNSMQSLLHSEEPVSMQPASHHPPNP